MSIEPMPKTPKPAKHPFEKMNPKPLMKKVKPHQSIDPVKAQAEADETKAAEVVVQTTLNKVQRIMKRDGINCWLCLEPLYFVDITVEHLCPSSVGGPNHIHNCVLTHSKCNTKLAAKSVAEKVRMREAHLLK